MATITAVHDLSGIGRCSLTTALAVLPAMGHTCYPLPTAVLSRQTAFSGYTMLDLTDTMPLHLADWNETGIQPDIIYTGFLSRGEQVACIAAYADVFPDALVLVDPVMGDLGQLYSCYRPAYVDAMRRLAKRACILIPNTTEMLLLSGLSAETPFPQEDSTLLDMARSIGSPRLQSIVITSAVRDGIPCNLLVEPVKGQVTAFPAHHNGIAYSGAGDLFASLLCGWLGYGISLRDSIPKAAAFVSRAADNTPSHWDPRLGLHYEPLLGQLAAQKP